MIRTFNPLQNPNGELRVLLKLLKIGEQADEKQYNNQQHDFNARAEYVSKNGMCVAQTKGLKWTP